MSALYRPFYVEFLKDVNIPSMYVIYCTVLYQLITENVILKMMIK